MTLLSAHVYMHNRCVTSLSFYRLPETPLTRRLGRVSGDTHKFSDPPLVQVHIVSFARIVGESSRGAMRRFVHICIMVSGNRLPYVFKLFFTPTRCYQYWYTYIYGVRIKDFLCVSRPGRFANLYVTTTIKSVTFLLIQLLRIHLSVARYTDTQVLQASLLL